MERGPENSHIPASAVRGRLAPSPTGYMHLGNAWAFLVAWLGARSAGGSLILRMEDIDPQRSRTCYEAALIEDLRWLGLDWDEGPESVECREREGTEQGAGVPRTAFRQSERLDAYAAALKKLDDAGLVYPCFCTRRELRGIAGAPQGDELLEPAYPGTCLKLSAKERERRLEEGRPHSWRLMFPPEKRLEFASVDDLIMGRQTIPQSRIGGDFVLRRTDGVFAYQLAVVLDDVAVGVNQVIRGADILASTPRQRYLYSLLGAKAPRYGHFPLLLDHEGERLAKRHASLSVRGLREAGIKPEAVTGWLACWYGLRDGKGGEGPCKRRKLCKPGDLLRGFEFGRVKTAVARMPQDIVTELKRLGG